MATLPLIAGSGCRPNPGVRRALRAAAEPGRLLLPHGPTDGSGRGCLAAASGQTGKEPHPPTSSLPPSLHVVIPLQFSRAPARLSAMTKLLHDSLQPSHNPRQCAARETLDYHFNLKCLLGAFARAITIISRAGNCPFVDLHPLILSGGNSTPFHLFFSLSRCNFEFIFAHDTTGGSFLFARPYLFGKYWGLCSIAI